MNKIDISDTFDTICPLKLNGVGSTVYDMVPCKKSVKPADTFGVLTVSYSQ